MHIAICDDNIADRKQMERLLKRMDYPFFDSYGNSAALLANPRQYDLFFLDMNNPEDLSVSQLVDALRAEGVRCPIVLCCSSQNYRVMPLPDDLWYIDKPIKTQELSQLLEDCKHVLDKLPTPLEIRSDTGTVFLLPEEILCCKGSGRELTVKTTDGREFLIRTTIENLYSQWMGRKVFYLLNGKTIINLEHIKEVTATKVLLSDGSVFRHFRQRSPIQCCLSKLHP